MALQYSLCIFIILRILCVNGAVFYMDEDVRQSRPLVVRGDRMDRFQTQILNLLGLEKPLINVELSDKFASKFMSSLYKVNNQFEEESHFSPNFRFLDEKVSDASFDMKKVQENMRASDTIISFLPKDIFKRNDSNNELDLHFNLPAKNFRRLHLIYAELYFVFQNSLAIGIRIKELDSEFSLLINLSDYANVLDLTFVPVNITQLFSNWMGDLEKEKKVSVEFIYENGNSDFSKLPKMHCFGVVYFVEGEREIMRRVKRSLFEIEENWDDEEEMRSSDQEESEEDQEAKWSDEQLKAKINPESLKYVSSTAASPLSAKEEASNSINQLLENAQESINTPPNLNLLTPLQTLKPTGRRCKVRSLYVDFKDLGWDNWVIAPSGYQADYCAGDCAFPLDSSINPTNHAIVQTLAHVLNEERVSPTSCVPIAMKSQSLLFFNNQNNVVMRRYHNMRVKQCGCH